MTDPVLDAHEILPGLYTISGGPSPISIRDQMLRGWLVVERLRLNQLIHDRASLLVVGAGAGGVTAAIWAADTKILDVSTDDTDGHQCMVQVGKEWEPAGGYNAPACHGKDHTVTLRDEHGKTYTDVFNVIVVRHGIRKNSVPVPPLPEKYKENLTLARPRHLLPYHLPA